MDIIIVGCGKVGQNLAVQLNNDGNNITVIDTAASKVNEVIGRHDIMGVVGNGATHLIQQEA
ncbi:MAG: NAD-binding protein, partial [Ruminococcus sp.]|nr:NAD-binding protein [Ruminococcus sp.]